MHEWGGGGGGGRGRKVKWPPGLVGSSVEEAKVHLKVLRMIIFRIIIALQCRNDLPVCLSLFLPVFWSALDHSINKLLAKSITEQSLKS